MALALCSRVYEEAICFSHSFGLGGIYFGLPFLLETSKKGTRTGLWAATLLFALASLSRATWFPVFFAFSVMVWAKQLDGNIKSLLPREAFPPLVGLFLAVSFQGWLNAVRFHDLTDFGTAYVSSQFRYSERMKEGFGQFSWRFIIPNLISYYFVRFVPEGGIVLGRTVGWFQGVMLKNIRFFESPHTISLTCSACFLGFIPLRNWIVFFKKIWPVVVLVSPLALINLSQDSIIYRYQLEVCLPLFLVSIPVLIAGSNELSPKWFLLTTVTCLVGLGFSFINSWEVINRFWKSL